MAVSNKTILAELQKFLKDADFFSIYPTRAPLQRYISEAVSDTDRIRAILKDEYVQRELFPDWSSIKDTPFDPLEHYLKHRHTSL